MGQTRLDDSRWPLAVFTAVGEQSPADFEAYLADSDTLLRRREVYGVIFDARRAAPIGPKLRKRQAEWLARNVALLRVYRAGTGMVLGSALQRGIFRAIMWVQPLPTPYSVESTLDGARRFVCARLLERGCTPLPLPSSQPLTPPAVARRARSVHPR
ncbi:MAG TPA: hypothetical protein VNN80_30010 [Polyangiaceae bacterium]|jgi:hypothetical protein|nr:hypothetical protein [Polyangiaceae bacterium]